MTDKILKNTNLKDLDIKIIHFVETHPKVLTKIILQNSKINTSTDITIRRHLSKLVKLGFLLRSGKGRAVTYSVSSSYKLVNIIDEHKYLKTPIDERNGQKTFNFDIFKNLSNISIFSTEEEKQFLSLQNNFQNNQQKYSDRLKEKEYQRVMIEFSWKSSAIEGNTYDLLETETLIKEGVFAKNKTKAEAQMILNHKEVFQFILENKNFVKNISLKVIEQLHSILISNLNITRGIRKRIVGITGTIYSPIDNEFQIKESLQSFCKLVNQKENIFEKSFLCLLLISYIQPFEDGNKRTARMLTNAILIANNSFPLSFRNMDITSYRQAVLLFYEKNYIISLRNIFKEQINFSANNYFL